MEVCSTSAKYGMWINFSWHPARPARSQNPSHQKHSVEGASSAASWLFPNAVEAQELFWTMMLELHGRWPFLDSCCAGTLSLCFGKGKGCMLWMPAVSTLQSCLLIKDLIREINVYMHIHTFILVHIYTQVFLNYHIYLRNVGLF